MLDYAKTLSIFGLLAAVALAPSCKGGEGDKKKDGAANTDPGTETGTGTSTGTGTGTGTVDDPCLRLQDGDTADVDSDIVDDEIGGVSEVGCSPLPDTDGADDPPSGGSGWNAGPGLESCAEEGKAWRAVVGGGPGSCGDPLVSWCCSESEVFRLFPAYKSGIEARFNEAKAQGMTLYHCSQADGRTTFHWAAANGGSISYRTQWFDAVSSATSSGTCPLVTSADLGISVDDGDPDDGGTGGVAIGVISDTSAAGIKTWLKQSSKPYASWTRDAAVRNAKANSPHGKVRTFYNASLKNSFVDGNNEHPVGSIAVKEYYETDGSTLKGYLLMAKAQAGSGSSNWLFYKIEGAPDLTGEPAAYGRGGNSSVSACVSCHQNQDIDFIRSTPPG